MARWGMMDFVACVACRGSDGLVRWAARHKAHTGMMGCPSSERRRWIRYDSSGARGVL